MGPPAVMIMAKVPREGEVKTRLAPLLGDSGCVRLQEILVRHVTGVAYSVSPIATYVAYSPMDGEAEMARLVPDDVVLFRQEGNDLGERMTNAVSLVTARHNGPLVIIGTDLPLISASHIRVAIEGLDGGNDAVIGPAHDGGYYLVALSRPLPQLFDIDPSLWGGPEVLEATLRRAQLSDLRIRLTEPLRDLDTVEDAQAMLYERELPFDVRCILADGFDHYRLGAQL